MGWFAQVAHNLTAACTTSQDERNESDNRRIAAMGSDISCVALGLILKRHGALFSTGSPGDINLNMI